MKAEVASSLYPEGRSSAPPCRRITCLNIAGSDRCITTSGSSTFGIAARSRRLKASTPRLKASTFSCDIAYSEEARRLRGHQRRCRRTAVPRCDRSRTGKRRRHLSTPRVAARPLGEPPESGNEPIVPLRVIPHRHPADTPILAHTFPLLDDRLASLERARLRPAVVRPQFGPLGRELTEAVPSARSKNRNASAMIPAFSCDIAC